MKIFPLNLNINQVYLPQKNHTDFLKTQPLSQDTINISFKGNKKPAKDDIIQNQAVQITDLKFELRQKEANIKSQEFIIKNLINLSAGEIDAKDPQNGSTLLHYASLSSWNKNPEAVESLIKKGYSVHAKDNNGQTPLHYAAQGDSKEIIKTLVKHKANINEEALDGSTPLHLAALWNQDEEIIKTLIDCGADVKTVDKGYKTPILNAVQLNQNPKIVKMMLEHGADPHAQDYEGWTACEYVREYRIDEETYKLLEPYYLERQAKLDKMFKEVEEYNINQHK